MPKHVLRNAHVSIAGVDLTDHVRDVTLNYSVGVQDISAMGDNAFRRVVSGIRQWSVDINFLQDFDSGKVDATLFSLVGGTAIALIIRTTTAAVGPTNPQFTGNGILETYPPLAGSHGNAHMVSVTIQGDGTLTRATA